MFDLDEFLGRDKWDKNRGLNADVFGAALEKAGVAYGDKKESTYDYEDPYSHLEKPQGVPVWDHPPATPQEEALYYGVHIHSESNPLGLHSHVPGGRLAGGHSHGPQNRFGAHHHRDTPGDLTQVDGKHEHKGVNYPDGKHDHHPDNFG